MLNMNCPTCARTGQCNPNAGRGQGRDCHRSLMATRRVFWLPVSSVRAISHCDGGERVENGNTATACAYCVNGICRTALAAEFYEPESEPAALSLWQRIRAAFPF